MTTRPSAPELIETKPAPKPGSYSVARQPILTADEKVFGYELLYREGVENYFSCADYDAAARRTLDSSMLMGFDVLCDGRRAFINCTRAVLLNEYPSLLPSAQTVIEVLETVSVDDRVVAVCKRLKDAGYLIALDDFGVDDPRESLTPLADIIKVDIRAVSPEQRATMIKRYKTRRCRMLAEKVETREEFTAAERAGFHYFQGYFFRRPEMLAVSTIPANKVNYLRMLQAASRPELDPREIENVVKSEASLCYRLLRYLNSAVFGFANEIHSVRHALSMLGEREVRCWMRLVATLAAGQNKTSDLVLSALVRARFCELLSPKIRQSDSDLFLMGLLSMMDAILELPMARVVETIPVHQDIKTVLLGEASRLEPIYGLMLAQEAGDWEKSDSLAIRLHLSTNDVAEKYWQSIQWAKDLSGG